MFGKMCLVDPASTVCNRTALISNLSCIVVRKVLATMDAVDVVAEAAGNDTRFANRTLFAALRTAKQHTS